MRIFPFTFFVQEQQCVAKVSHESNREIFSQKSTASPEKNQQPRSTNLQRVVFVKKLQKIFLFIVFSELSEKD